MIYNPGGGGGAPLDATFITQTPNATLTAAQALSALATGLLKNTTGTGVLSIAAAADLPAHNVLSASHGDSLTASVVRGDLFIGNSTPKWARLAIGAAASILSSDGTDVSWEAATGTGAPVCKTGAVLITPTLGVALATSVNGNIFTVGTYTLTGVAGKTLTFNKSLTLDGTDSTTMTFPTTSATLARTDAAQTFTGSQTIAALVGPVTITEAVGSSGLTITGATQTSNFPALSVTQTWNNSGTAFTAAKFNITLTAFSSTSVFMDFLNAGTRVMAVGPSGQICGAASNNFGTVYINGNQTSYNDSVVAMGGGSAEGVTCRSQGWFAFSSSSSNALHSNKDTIISRGGAAATVQLGLDVNGAAVAQILQAANGITGTDKAGGNLTFNSGKGTGAATVSQLLFGTPTVLASGTTAQTITTRLTIDSLGLTIADTMNLIASATTGTKIGTATSQKLALWNATPIIQPAAAGQAAITDSTGGTPAASLVDVGVVFSQSAINANFATVAVLLLAMRTAMVNFGSMKGAA